MKSKIWLTHAAEDRVRGELLLVVPANLPIPGRPISILDGAARGRALRPFPNVCTGAPAVAAAPFAGGWLAAVAESQGDLYLIAYWCCADVPSLAAIDTDYLRFRVGSEGTAHQLRLESRGLARPPVRPSIDESPLSAAADRDDRSAAMAIDIDHETGTPGEARPIDHVNPVPPPEDGRWDDPEYVAHLAREANAPCLDWPWAEAVADGPVGDPCPLCGERNPVDDTHCRACLWSLWLDPGEAADLASPSAPAAERG